MTFETEINTTKVSSTKLGIPKDLTQERFNQAIVKVLEEIKDAMNAGGTTVSVSSASQIKTNVATNVVKSLNFEPAAATFKTQLNDSSIDITYSLNDVINSLPKEAQIRKVEVIADGSRTVIKKTDQKTMTIPVAPIEFPVILNFQIRGDSSEGSFILTGSTELKAENKEGIVSFNSQTTQFNPIETQEDLNKKLLEEIAFLKRSLK